jgi:hypothetical protein
MENRDAKGGVKHCLPIKPPPTKNTATRMTDYKEGHKLPGEDHHQRCGEGLMTMATNTTKTDGLAYNNATIIEENTSPHY